MEHDITVVDVRRRTQLALESVTIPAPTDMSERIETRLIELTTEELEKAHAAIEQAVERQTGISNTRHVYTIEVSDPSFKEQYAQLMTEIAERVCQSLIQEGFSASSSSAHIHNDIPSNPTNGSLRITVIILIGWA